MFQTKSIQSLEVVRKDRKSGFSPKNSGVIHGDDVARGIRRIL